MLFGVGLGEESLQELGPLARLADDLGFHNATIVDVPTLMREHTVMMTIAALSTSRMLVGQGVTEPFTYHPVAIASASASVREITEGRAFLGVGTGAAWAKPGTKVAPLRELREAIQFMRAFTSGDDAVYKGRQVHAAWIRRSPWAGTPVPVLMACSGVKACELAGELADMAMMIGADPDLVGARIGWVRRGAERAGRDPASVQIWVRTQMYVADAKEQAFRECAPYGADEACNFYSSTCTRDTPERLEVRAVIERRYPGLLEQIERIWNGSDPYQWAQPGSPQARLATQQVLDAFSLTGPAEGIVGRIRDLEELGVTGVSAVLYALEDKPRVMRDIAERVMPHFS